MNHQSEISRGSFLWRSNRGSSPTAGISKRNSCLVLLEGSNKASLRPAPKLGVKAIDVAWLVPERRQEVRSVSCLVQAPEICVEVLSPSNTAEEISEKIALYFESGAREVGSASRTELSCSTSPPHRSSPIVRDVSGVSDTHQRLNSSADVNRYPSSGSRMRLLRKGNLIVR